MGYSRETQTVTMQTRSQQTRREFATQMARRDLYLDTSKDVVIVPRPYFSADELHVRVLRWWRWWCGWEMGAAR